MARSMKLTGFARFLIFLLFAAPLAYVGATYYTEGSIGLDRLKEQVGLSQDGVSTPNREKSLQKENSTLDPEALQIENQALREKIEEKEEEIQQLKDRIRELQQ